MQMRRMGRRGRSLLVDYVPLEKLLAMHAELRPFIEDGSVVYFEACLTQMRQGNLQLLVEGLLGIPWSKLQLQMADKKQHSTKQEGVGHLHTISGAPRTISIGRTLHTPGMHGLL